MSPAASDLRSTLKSALAAFTQKPLREASLSFFKTLGYISERTVIVPKSSPRAFLDLFAKTPGTAPFDQEKALFADWVSADLLFQLTDDEVRSATAPASTPEFAFDINRCISSCAYSQAAYFVSGS